eukprot:CAMPEP_0119425888 /NCGR_PEP_ID=MMETSP1335-20130426/35292_1 /TAXON_ID=259385 /ORGANISM="Chrysoculter rhomboideus, Strain RCC1486" /LENGTH=52 /DNA_ID=CAMNT_0007451467 /DNA_START=31 /DNA_END=189 /DNA_ORIENTATION=+
MILRGDGKGGNQHARDKRAGRNCVHITTTVASSSSAKRIARVLVVMLPCTGP